MMWPYWNRARITRYGDRVFDLNKGRVVEKYPLSLVCSRCLVVAKLT
jgi:hypothetical protein